MSNKYNNNGTPISTISISSSSSSSSSANNNNNKSKINNESKNKHRPVLLLFYLLVIGIVILTKESNTTSNMSLEQKVEQTLAEDTDDDQTITTNNNNNNDEEENEDPITVTAEAAVLVVVPKNITQVVVVEIEIANANANKTNEVPLRPNNKYNPSWLVVSHSKKLAITIIPKVMCSTIRDAFNNKLEHCGLPTPMTPEPEPPVLPTNTDTDTTHHPVVVVDSVVDSDSDSFTEQQPQISGYTNNTLPLKILQTIPLKEQMQLKTLKRRMIQRFQEKNVIGRCTEARRNPELRYNHSMYLTEDHYTTVLIVRDPFERAYSAYKNSDSNTNIYLNDDDGEGGVCSNTTNCTFEVWVNKLIHFRQSKKSAIKNNEHFKTQIEIAQFHKIHYHYKLRMTSQIDLTFLFQDLMGFNNGIPTEHINSSSSASKNNNTANGSSSSSSSSKRKRSGRLQQQKDNNNVTITTTTATIDNNNNSDRILKLFESISSKTMNQLAIFYKDDLKLWQELLDDGSPRSSSSPGEEITLYDYFLLSDQNQKKMITT